MVATTISTCTIRVPSVGLLTQIFTVMSSMLIAVSGHECKLLSLYGKKTADCDNLSLKSIPNDLEHDIQILLFRDNEITYLGMDEFTNYRALQQIRMVRNRIDMIAPDAFRYLYNLQILDLEGNKITNIPPSIFQHLTSVRIVNMKSNPLVFLTKDALSHLKNVEELNFENCWLERIHPQAFRGLTKLYELNLVNNELKVLDAEMQHYLPRSLKVMRIHRNPWNCDCQLRWLREYIENRKIQWNFYSNVPVCDLPELIHDIAWNNLDPERFACAAQILAVRNMSTSFELEVRGNVTINCIVQGDPKPDITWMKGSRFVPPAKISERQCLADDGTVQFCSSLTLKDLQLSDEGDYRCIAKNYAGRSEITYKLWVHDPTGGLASLTLYGLTSETLIGIGIGAGVLVLLIVACVVWMVKRQNNGTRKQPYKIRNYKKPSHNNHENHSPMKKNKEPYEAEEEERPVISEAKDKDKASTRISDNCELVLINHKSPEPPSVPSPVLENHLNAAKNKEFKMTLFKGEEKTDDRSNLDKTITGSDSADGLEASVTSKTKPTSKTTNAAETQPPENTVPPDVVQRTDGTKMPIHQPLGSPTSPSSIGNHVQSQGHRRAEENPYAKPSEMKPTKQKKPDSKLGRKPEERTADTRPKGSQPKETTFGEPAKARDDGLVAVETSGPDKKRVTTFAVEPPSCKNPVCLKEHSGDSPRARSPIKTKEIGEKDTPALSTKQHIKGSKSMSGLNDSPEKSHNSGTRSPPGVRILPTSDRYKTLPSQPKVPAQTDGSRTYGPYGRAPPSSHDAYSIPPTRQSLGHYAIPSGQVVDPARLPAKIPTASQRQLPPASRSQYHEPQIHGFQPSMPPDPIPAHLRSKSLTPRPTPGGHVADRPTSSPTRKLTKTFEATSLDDLLSPPFGHITVDKHKQARTQANKLPKPGEKDEYGTAV